MKVDAAFLREVQKRGWVIEAVTEAGCVARCASQSCALRVMLKPGSNIPAKLARDGTGDITLQNFADASVALRERREELLLTIVQVEEATGLAGDHIAKAEMETPQRKPSVDLFIVWANALGYEVVLRSVPLPPITLREIVDSRGVADRRRRHFARKRR